MVDIDQDRIGALQQGREPPLALEQGTRPQILPVELEQVESVIADPRRSTAEVPTQAWKSGLPLGPSTTASPSRTQLLAGKEPTATPIVSKRSVQSNPPALIDGDTIEMRLAR
jgi:hypothetical protein